MPGGGILAKIYRVTLTDVEREEFIALIARRNEKALPVKRAYQLLAADENGEKGWADIRIAETYEVGVRTVERTRQRFVEDRFEVAVDNTNSTPFLHSNAQ